ncbi:MAG: sigma-54 dependent transcriptional regulator [Myxococcales bacterium]|nr:sigma-54 dependent transcriptional regulator [Myxococcales bacterium]
MTREGEWPSGAGAGAGVAGEHGSVRLIGTSKGMVKLGEQIRRAAASPATVLVIGESGTGKELVARAIHALSSRRRNPLVAVNCAALTDPLLDSELFGHAKGAFTGAMRARRGLFEEADGGTLFIDEISETSPTFQAKLLRALQEREIRRVGENGPIQVDARIVAATNQDLALAVAEQRFRKDLFYRLSVVPLHVPPLRERTEDIALLARHFLDRCAARLDRGFVLTAAALEHLQRWDYPGNVRELENAIERAVALAASDVLTPDDFPFASPPTPIPAPAPTPTQPALRSQVEPEAEVANQPPVGLAEALKRAERQIILAALVRSPGNLAAVAQELKISSTTLWRKMRRLGLSGPAPHLHEET